MTKIRCITASKATVFSDTIGVLIPRKLTAIRGGEEWLWSEAEAAYVPTVDEESGYLDYNDIA